MQDLELGYPASQLTLLFIAQQHISQLTLKTPMTSSLPYMISN